MRRLLIPLALSLFFVTVPVGHPPAFPAYPPSGLEAADLPVIGRLDSVQAGRDGELAARIDGLVETGDYDGAIAASRERVSSLAAAVGEDDPLTLAAQQQLGELLVEYTADHAEGVEVLRAVVEGWEQLLEKDHPRRLSAMDALGWALKQRGKLLEAEPLLREALEGRRRVCGNDAENTLTSVHHLGSLLNAAGRREEAEPYYREAYETAMRTFGPEDPATMSFQNNMAFLLDNLGRYVESEALYRDVLEKRRRVLGADHINTVNTMNNLGGLLIHSSQYEESQALLEEALKHYRRLLGDEHPSTLNAINNLGLVLKQQGRFAAAEALMRESAMAKIRTLGRDHYQTLTTMNNLAGVIRAQGRLAEAEALYVEVLEGDRRVLGDRHPNTLSTMHNLTLLLSDQGRLAEAESLARVAAGAREETLGPEHPDTLRTMDSLGLLLFYLGRYDEAEEVLRRASATRRRALEPGHAERFDTDVHLGNVLLARERLDEAERLYRRALENQRRTLGPDNPRTMAALSNLGHLHYARGAFDEAEACYREALERRRRVLGGKHQAVVKSLNALATVKGDTGKYREAEALWREAAGIFEAVRLRASTSGLERVFVAERLSPLWPLAACLARNGKALPAWEAYEENLARGLLDAISARYARPLSAEERRREADLIGRLSRIDEQIGAAGEEADALSGERMRLTAELARFETELAGRYGPTAGEVFSLSRIQRALPAATALVGWVDVPAGPHAADPGGDHWACVVPGKGEPVWVRLPGSGDRGVWTAGDTELAGRVRRLLERPQQRSASRRNRVLFQRLRAQRLDPLRPYLAGVDQLVVVPGGVMAGIPVEALDDGFTVSYTPSGTMYAWLRENAADGERPGGSAPPRLLALGDPDFGEAPKAPAAAEPPAHGVLVAMVMDGSNAYSGGIRDGDVLLDYAGTRLGTPDDLGPAIREAAASGSSAGGQTPAIPVTVWRGGETHRLELAPGRMGLMPVRSPMPGALLDKREMDAALGPVRGGAFEPLPGSRREVQAIARLFGEGGEERNDEILLGGAASEERLAGLSASGALKRFGVIHLATHGVMNDRLALESALILARPPVGAAEMAAYDGRLTGEQIVRTWELDADLVTLSGCETALGRRTAGEGYLGFSQAMFIAGARSLLLSLWKVNDQATMLLMTRFYENLLGKFTGRRSVGMRSFSSGQAMTRSLALREAREYLAGYEDQGGSRPFADPHFWAAFVLIGDPG